MKDRIFVDIHILQTVPPSCVNRDDTGSPKTAIYGGVTRARVSSQSWKRAMRVLFKDLFPKDDLAFRTLKVLEMVSDEIKAMDNTVDATVLAKTILEAAGIKIKKDVDTTGALFFMSVAQAKALAKLAVDNIDELTSSEGTGKELKNIAIEALGKNPGVEIALFGRMVADNPTLNTDACAQVSHSISTHKVSNEYDYFTAVDELLDEGSTGAGHIGTVEYNSATLYRYATVSAHSLREHLGKDTSKAIENFVYSFICSMPDGKQNTFANRTLPDAVLVTIRDNQPISFVGAFERPVVAGDEGYVVESTKRLANHAKSVYKNYAGAPLFSFVIGDELSAYDIGVSTNLTDLCKKLGEELDVLFNSEGGMR